jgi:hypothetical protein
LKDATRNCKQIREWFERDGGYNLAVAVPPGFVLLDVDGIEAQRRLEAMGYDLPETAVQKTPREGGRHYWYTVPDGVELRQTAGEIAEGVDTRASGKGYALVDPSVIDGKPYRWEIPPATSTTVRVPDAVAPAPQWLIDLLRVGCPHKGSGSGAPAAQRPPVDGEKILAGVAEGARDVELYRYACKLERMGRTPQEITALVLYAAENCSPPFPRDQAHRKVDQALKHRQAAPAIDAPISPQLRWLNDVEPEDVGFLWDPYIPLGKLSCIEGDPGQGKSWITAALATAGSLGIALPGGRPPEGPWCTLLCAAEDGIADTLVKRAKEMGAAVAAGDGRYIAACEEAFDVGSEEGIAILRRWIEQVHPKLVILDPITAYTRATIDTHKANHVRGLLQPLAALAREYDCAIVIIRHLTKGPKGKAVYAGLGSIDYSAAARSVLLAGESGDDPSLRAIIHTKCNYSAKGPAIGYDIVDGRFLWTGHSPLTSEDILRSESSSEERSAVKEAEDYLRDRLSGGPAATKEVEADARQAGIAQATLRRARARLGVKSRKCGYKTGQWELFLSGASIHPAPPQVEPKQLRDKPKALAEAHSYSPKSVSENGVSVSENGRSSSQPRYVPAATEQAPGEPEGDDPGTLV